jgi:hypothetical protein
VTVKQFQNIAKIEAMDDISHMALIVCSLYGYSEDYVDNMPPKKALKLFAKVTKKVQRVEKSFLFGTRKMQVDAFKLTFGQFIEINYWLKSGEIEAYHLIAASAIGSNNHKALADTILHQDVRRILLPVRKLLISYSELLMAYKNLFEIDKADASDEETHPFIEQYGWLFSAKRVGEYLGLNVNDTYKISIVEAFNTLAYLKNLNEYEAWQSRKI